MNVRKKIVKFFKGRMCDAEWNDFCATLAGVTTAFVLLIFMLAIMAGDITPLAWRK